MTITSIPSHDDAKRRRQALQLVRRTASKHRESERSLNNAMRFAREQGISLRDVGEAAGIPHTTVADRLRITIADSSE